jgi:hypothetical protein
MGQETTPTATEPSSFTENSQNTAQLEQNLRCRLGHRIFDLRLWSEAHGLVLSGCSHSYYDKQMAQQIVKELSGLVVADNRILVDSRAMDSTPARIPEISRHGAHAGDARRLHTPTDRHYFSH